eukprot:5103774-Amphidinium_carterae.1
MDTPSIFGECFPKLHVKKRITSKEKATVRMICMCKENYFNDKASKRGSFKRLDDSIPNMCDLIGTVGGPSAAAAASAAAPAAPTARAEEGGSTAIGRTHRSSHTVQTEKITLQF